MSQDLSFVVDAMLGDLARWLRMLGYDTLYPGDISDRDLLEIAVTENRVLVTRDKGLYSQALKKKARSILITGTSIDEKLYEVALAVKNLRLEVDPDISRCPVCNGVLEKKRRHEVKDKVPPGVYKAYNEFWVCSKCGKIYWKGGHWRGIEKTLERVKKMLRSRPRDLSTIFGGQISFLNRA